MIFDNFYIIILFIILNLILTVLLFKFSFKIKLLDYPDIRKRHSSPTPSIGGLIIFLNILLFYNFIHLDFWINIIFISSSIILFVGLIDDKFQLGVTIRLIAQLSACLLVMGSGLYIFTLGNYEIIGNIKLGLFGFIVTILCVMGLTNAINFMDGIDGLAPGIILNSFFSLILFSHNNIGFEELNLIILLSISVCIFIYFNVFSKKYKIFLGNSGSMSLGFLIAWLLIYFSHPDIKFIHPVMTIWCVAIPVYDFFNVLIIRMMRKQNPFRPDRRHIHHLLLSLGYNQKNISLSIFFISILHTIFGYIFYIYFGALQSLLFFIAIFLLHFIFNNYIQNLVNKKTKIINP